MLPSKQDALCPHREANKGPTISPLVSTRQALLPGSQAYCLEQTTKLDVGLALGQG